MEQERKTRVLLEEKENAFDRLDLLHRRIIESVNTGIMTTDLAGKIKSFNRAAEQITGHRFASVEGQPMYSVFPAFEDSKANVVLRGHDGSEIYRREIEFATGDGARLILGFSISPLRDAESVRIGDIFIFQDLSSIKKMEKEMENSRRLAFIGSMSAAFAHEIRNPLASISGSVQLLRKDLQLSKGDERLMEIILRGKEQLESFMKDFLLLARPTPGTREYVDVVELTEEVLNSLTYLPDWTDDIEVIKTFAPDTKVFANRTEIRQIVWNLMLNAIQAMPGGGQLTVDVQNVQTAKDGHVALRVSDTGDGIDAEAQDKIFEPFFTTKEYGTGLGLAIVLRIVENYRGSVQVVNNSPRGTIFVISLPIGGPS
ncbi:MAG: ATP-binding protein [Smithellaceae bacterium]|nr:ATP-binding protein [Smithellaceae bacterium]